MRCSRIISVTALLISLTLNDVVGRRVSLAPPCYFPAIYNFGDSNSDTGGKSAAFGPIPPPYGGSFFGHPAGRETDGRLIIDFTAEHLGLPYLSSYLDSIASDFRHGANFAAGGSSIRRPNGTISGDDGSSPFSLDIQIVQFDQFKLRMNELYHSAGSLFDRSKLPRPREFSRSLYTFDIGQSDLIDGFGKLSKAQLRLSFADIVNQLASAITNLYQQGARVFWIHNTGPVGCLPAATFYIRNAKPGFLDKYGCIRYQNNMAVEFNRQLKARVVKLRAELPHASLIYVDVYSAKYHLISNTRYYGFMDPLKICCGVHLSNIYVWCGQSTFINGSEIVGASCGSPESYVSWDGVHYSEAANQWTANHILDGSFSDPPTPVASACLKH